MGDKDPPPFGYTFTGFFDGDSTPFDNGQSLLTDTESQSIADFFSSTDPFHLSDASAFPPPPDSKHAYSDFNDWSNFVTPATVHGVSATIPDQPHLHTGLFNDLSFAQPPSLPSNHLANTQDDLQAAETLFNNSQASFNPAARSQSFHALPSSSRDNHAADGPILGPGGRPMVVTQHGLLNEQLASLLPNHNQNGTVDAQLAAQWAATDVEHLREVEFADTIRKPNLKRSYTFGTDNSFNNPAGYSAPHNTDPSDHVHVARNIIRAIRHSQPTLPTVGSNDADFKHIHNPSATHDDASDGDPSEEASSDDDEDDRPAKKRRRSKAFKETPRKQARSIKARKGPNPEDKKKRPSTSQKMQRENLTEEQKRNNHILSEQKRRNLIKRGFDDLHDLVPEIRNGGLSKSSVLMEAGNFLEKIIQDNIAFSRIIAG